MKQRTVSMTNRFLIWGLHLVCLIGFRETGNWLGGHSTFRDTWALYNIPFTWLVCALSFATYGLIGPAGGETVSRFSTCAPIVIILVLMYAITSAIEVIKLPDQDRGMLVFVVFGYFFLPSLLTSIPAFLVANFLARSHQRASANDEVRNRLGCENG